MRLNQSTSGSARQAIAAFSVLFCIYSGAALAQDIKEPATVPNPPVSSAQIAPDTSPAAPAAQPSSPSLPAAATPAVPSSGGTVTDVAPEAKTKETAQAPAPAPIVTSIDVKPGDHWVYDLYDDITGDLKTTQSQVLTEIKDRTFDVQILATPAGRTLPGPPLLAVFDDNWNLLENTVWTSHPGDPSTGVRLPLKLGAKWDSHFSRLRHQPEIRVAVTATSEVTAWERVKLRSGSSYDTFRIETQEHARAFGALKYTDIKAVVWFAPEVNRFVKRDVEIRVNGRLMSHEVQSLTAYTRRDTDN